MEKPLKKSIKRLWGIGDLGLQIMIFIEATYFLYFMTDVVKFSLETVTLISFIGSASTLILAPFAGAVINTAKAMKWGRVRSWLLVTPPFVIILFTLQFTAINNGFLGAAVIIFGYVLGHFLYTICDVANLAIVPKFANDDASRIFLSSRRIIGMQLGRLINSYVLPLAIISYTSKVTDPKIIYTSLAFFGAVIMTLGYWVYFKLSKGYEEENSGTVIKNNEKLTFKEILNVFSQNKHLVGLLFADLTSNLSQTMSPSLAVYYCKYVAQDIYLLPKMLLANSLCSLIGAIVIGRVYKNNNRIYKRNILIIIYGIVALIALCLKLSGFNITMFVVLYAAMHFFTAMSQPMESASYMDIGIFHEWKTGKNATSFIVGLTHFPVRIANMIRLMLISFTLMAVGYVAGAAPTLALKTGIINACAVVPIITAIFGILALLIFYRLSPEDMSKMKSEIAKRENSNI